MAKKTPILLRPDMLVGDHELKSYFEIERRLRYFPPFITTVILLNIFVFFWSGYTFVMNSSDNLVIEGKFQGAFLFDQPMRMITSSFLHSSLQHIFGNMILLYICGIMLEHLYGTTRTLIFYAVTCLTTSFATYLFFDPEIGSVGASGSVFAVVGMLVTFYILYAKHIFWRHRTVGWVILIFSLFLIYQGFTVAYVNNASHVGGFLTGVVFGFVFKPLFQIGQISKDGLPLETSKQKKIKWVSLKVFTLGVLLPFYIMQTNLSPWGNISFEEKFKAFVAYLLNPPKSKAHYTQFWRLPIKNPQKVKVNDRTSPSDDKAMDPSSRSKSSKGNQSNNNSKTPGDQSSSYDEVQKAGADSQGRVCPVCIKGSGKVCDCDPKCKWAYFHHYKDEKCRVKVLTNIWGPNTGSPFLKGFKSNHCVEYLGRYYSWGPPHFNCYSPTDIK